MTTEQRTIEFHQAFSHPVRDTPQTLCRTEAILALKLIEEEYHELCEALFPGSTDLLDSPASNIEDGRAPYEPNLIEVADALADLDVVINGAGIRHGFDMQALSHEVFSSNMSKLDADGKPLYRDDGKIAKSSLFREPDIAGALGIKVAA
ncbi:nucleoside triphosphate pyrophosphohydrolase family protein [Arthrobacter sp. ISL-95]|uniref:nucleoside triphosphate pyrophosphohydrolase family protein n=1 Tax=Arthrobacter sp. ISL-95 TaxID=2819116 RepID=UPI001BECEC07|nr:nucleoside triphosphate pyrophosphohydrolase family protein [Arthrobacter sp. ISL-95]MBT2587932.1 nucleoside triphosphate pyrophosphohydrolase family protein [Arthrobacter sp. ISL-95]